MSTTFVGSKEKSQTGRGQNNDATPVTTRDKLAPIPKVSPPNADADPGNWQTREVSTEAIKTHPGALPRGTGGELSGTVPSKLSGK